MDWKNWANTAVLVVVLLLTVSLIGTAGCGGKNSAEQQQEAALAEQAEAGGNASSSTETEVVTQGETTQEGENAGAEGQSAGTLESAASGEDFAVATPTQRYVSETQRHQNFLAAVASGDVRRMDFTSIDFQPVDDPNSSYITFSLATSGGERSTGVMVMKFESGLWRLSAVKQLGGSLEGGTNYLVPASFEETLAAELEGHQPFFTKLAEGKVSALIVDEDQHPSDTETVLVGRVMARSGRYENTAMYLSKDYSLWHLTGFDYR